MPSLSETLEIWLYPPGSEEAQVELLDIEADADWHTHTDWEAYGDTHVPRDTSELRNVEIELAVNGRSLREYVKEGWRFEAGNSAMTSTHEIREWVVEQLEKD